MKCPYCGSEIEENASMCKICGAILREEPKEIVKEEPVANTIITETKKEEVIDNSKGGIGGGLLVLTIIIVLLLGIGLGYMLFGQKNKNNVTVISTTTKTTKAIVTNYVTEDNTYSYSVPSNIKSTFNGTNLTFSDTANKWTANLQIVDGIYNTLLNNKASLTQVLANQGITAEAATEKTIGTKSYLILNAKTTTFGNVFFTDIDGTKLYYGYVIYMDSAYTDSYLNIINSIISSAKVKTASSLSLTNTLPDVSTLVK